MPTGDPPVCQCPPNGWTSWCQLHGSHSFTATATAYPTTTATTGSIGYGTWGNAAGWVQSSISDADVERIAKRVVELLKGQAGG